MAQDIGLIVIPVKDPAAAKKLYTQVLGTEPYVDEPYYIGYKLGEFEVGLDPNGHAEGLTGPVPYVVVDDIKQSQQDLIDAGAQPLQPVKDVGGGLLVASVKDADGNIIGLRQQS